MSRSKPALYTLIVSSCIFLLFVCATFTLLPARVATHFSASGQPDAWMSRRAHLAFLLGGALFTVVMCVGPVYLSRYAPDSLINLPHKDYWLSPEHREETHDRLFAFGLWLADLIVFMFIGLHALILRANRREPVLLPFVDGASFTAAVLIGVGALVVKLILSFRRIDPDASSRS